MTAAETASRAERQKTGIAKWKAAGANAAWCYATGFGKTHTALDVIKLVRETHANAVVHIVCPTLYLQAQFYAALKQRDIQDVQVFVINSYVASARSCDLLIVDECHLMIGENALQFPKIFSDVCKHRWVLALSATLTPEEQQRLATLGIPVCDTISMAEAQKAGWVARCQTYNLGVQLSAEEKREYKHHQEVFSSSFARFSHDFSLAMSCLQAEPRNAYAQQMGWREELGKDHRWSPQTLGKCAMQWLRATQGRQKVVNHAAAKYAAAAYLCTRFPVKALCFSESTAFASHLASLMPDICRAYHSQLATVTEEYTVTKTFKTKPDEILTRTRKLAGTSLRKRAIEDFGALHSDIRVLSTAKALDQGADFAGLQLGIETSGNSSIRQKVQRTGRVVRQEKGLEEKLAVYVHLYALGTYEANKLRRKQKGLQNIIETVDIQDITF